MVRLELWFTTQNLLSIFNKSSLSYRGSSGVKNFSNMYKALDSILNTTNIFIIAKKVPEAALHKPL